MKTFFSTAALAFVLSPENVEAQLSYVPQRLRTAKQYIDINEWGRQLEEEIKAEDQRQRRELTETDASMSMAFMSIPSSFSFDFDFKKEQEIAVPEESGSVSSGEEDMTTAASLEEESSAANEEVLAVESTSAPAEEHLSETEDGQSSVESIIEEENSSKEDEPTPEQEAGTEKDAGSKEESGKENPEEEAASGVSPDELETPDDEASTHPTDTRDEYEKLEGEELDQHL